MRNNGLVAADYGISAAVDLPGQSQLASRRVPRFQQAIAGYRLRLKPLPCNVAMARCHLPRRLGRCGVRL
jgi:hypothetical protein